VYDKKVHKGTYNMNKDLVYEAILSNLQRDGQSESLLVKEDKEADAGERKSLCISIFTLLISIPALIGA